jgi:hypothetical protein
MARGKGDQVREALQRNRVTVLDMFSDGILE